MEENNNVRKELQNRIEVELRNCADEKLLAFILGFITYLIEENRRG